MGQALEEFSPLPYTLLGLPLLILAVAAVLAMKPTTALGVIGIAAVLLVGLATAVFTDGVVLPLIDPMVGASFVYVATLGYRFAISDKDKRFLRRTFALYLAPAVVDRMVEENVRPALGGETRELTVMFSDVARFSAISEGLAPSELVGCTIQRGVDRLPRPPVCDRRGFFRETRAFTDHSQSYPAAAK